jgi:transposase-like protein
MSTTPLLHKKSSQKKLLGAAPESAILQPIVDELTETKIIYDLLGKANSVHEVQEHFVNVYRIERKYWAIRRVVLGSARRVAAINAKFDQIVCAQISLMVFDETFKGRHVRFLVVADARKGYLLFFRWLPEGTTKAILDLLMPYQDLFRNVKVVLTDGATYYPEVIKTLCPDAKHQRCLIHIIRKLFPFVEPTETLLHQAMTVTQEAKTALEHYNGQHGERAPQLKRFRQQITYWERKRAALRQQHHIGPNAKKILEKYPELARFNDNLNEVRTKYRSMRATFVKDKLKHGELKKAFRFAKNRQDAFWNRHMGQLHVLYRFYGLFQKKPEDFVQEREKCLKYLAKRSGEALAREIMKILTEIPSLDAVFTAECPIRLSRSFINTNCIESINSRLRPVLDKLKKWQDTPYSAAILDLIRLRLNASRPYRGPRRNSAPIERYGYDLRSRTWIGLILHGLPSGPQSKIFLPQSESGGPTSAIVEQC